MKSAQLSELLLQSLEHERGGVLIYQTALECVVNKGLREEWEGYLAHTLEHVEILTEVCEQLGLDPTEKTAGCQVVHHLGKSMVSAMKLAIAAGDAAAAELVACDCVVLAETKDHANWGLIGLCAKAMSGDSAAILLAAYGKVENEEDEHLYHTRGWCRELWLKSLGLAAVLPPPEEVKDVKTAIEAAKASGNGRTAHAR